MEYYKWIFLKCPWIYVTIFESTHFMLQEFKDFHMRAAYLKNNFSILEVAIYTGRSIDCTAIGSSSVVARCCHHELQTAG